jgi:hypothetical protein
MESALTDAASASPAGDSSAFPTGDSTLSQGHSLLDEGSGTGEPGAEEALSSAFTAEINDSSLVLSPGYIGPDRRAAGLWARVYRATFLQRRKALSLEFAIVVVVLTLGIASVVLIGGGHTSATPSVKTARNLSSTTTHAHPAAVTPTPVSTTLPAPTTTVPAPTTTAPEPTTTSPPTPTAAATPVLAATPATTAPAPAPTTALTPVQMGDQALALVRYPWQQIPGYSIQFLPISDAPSPGFYGNTTFTWGRAGGTSDLYVYPGESVATLAGITAFEIGHEVDAAAVEPGGGEAQVENVLGIHPASWAPNCDCAEQGFLSGWYAAAFSNYWSPGVGNWSQLAPEPSGAVLAAIEPWLNPTIP